MTLKNSIVTLLIATASFTATNGALRGHELSVEEPHEDSKVQREELEDNEEKLFELLDPDSEYGFELPEEDGEVQHGDRELADMKEHFFELLPPESEYGFELSEDGFEPSLDDMDIELAPEDRASNSTNNRKLASYNSNEYNMAAWVNYERRRRGLRALYWSADLLDESQRWSNYMVRTGSFRHRNPLSQNIRRGWRRLTENLANHWSIGYSGAHTSLMRSDGHRRNILDPNVNRIGVGVRRNSRGQYYVTEIFKQV